MMQKHTGHVSMDPELQVLRVNMQNRICKLIESNWLERKHNNLPSEWKQRLPDIAKRLEESILKKSLNKDDYMSKFQSGIENYIINMVNQMERNQQQQHQLHQQQQLQQQNHQQTMVHHNIQSNSLVSGTMMIPTPCISHNLTGAIRISSSMESNQGINPTSGPAGTMSNRYRLSHGNMSINQPGNSSMSASIGVRHQVMPMNSISTTQVSQQTMPMNSDYNNGSGIQPQKHQQYNTLSGQVGPGTQSDPMNQKHSSQGFGDGMINNNNGIRLFGKNIQQLMNEPGMSEGYMGIGDTYGNPTKLSSQGSGDGMMNHINGIRLFGQNIQQLTDGIRLFGNNIQLRPSQHMQQNHQMVADSNNSHNGNALIEKNQISQSKLNQSEGVWAPDPMNQKHSSQGFGDGMINNNNGIRLFGKNIQQLMNEPGMSEVYMGTGDTYGNSTKHSSQGSGDGMMNNINGIRLFGQNIQQLTDGIRLFGNNIQLRPTQHMQQNHQMVADSNNGHNSNALIEKNQISQSKLNQSEGVRAPGPTVITTVVPNEGSTQLSQRETQYQTRLKLLLFLLHAKHCTAPDGHCRDKNCLKLKQLLGHIETCYLKQCRFRLCLSTRKLLLHFHNCRELNCPVCIPARKFEITASDSKKDSNGKEVVNKVETEAGLAPVEAPFALPASPSASLALKHSLKGMNQLDSSSGVFSDQMDAEPLSKRRRMDISPVSVNNTNLSFSAMQEAFPIEQSTSNIHVKQDTHVEIDSASQNLQISSTVSDTSSAQMGYGLDAGPAGPSLLVENEERNDENATEAKQEEMEEDESANKSGQCKIRGVSMMEFFTPEQVIEHIESLKQWVDEVHVNDYYSQFDRLVFTKPTYSILSDSMSQEKTEESPGNSCQICRVEKLIFNMVPIYCTPCGARIKKKGKYYLYSVEDHKHAICSSCFRRAKGEAIEIESQMIPKAQLEMKINDEQIEEEWVQCDKCNAWVHHICALFNKLGNAGDEAEYTCPTCYLHELESGRCKPLPESAMLGAKDLPRTRMSDYIEKRLFKQLEMERQERANSAGNRLEDVPGAEGLVLRVVSSVNMLVKVKRRFSEIFKESYPTHFPYKSKGIFLFQKIDGVEVSIFAIFVHEFGTECAFPNQRSVYLSYVDSVKYFRPDIKTSKGEALRTFVFHQVLLGYLDWCKKRGFSSCYLWACPPRKGDDYIFYSHPKVQKTPKPDRLREWYRSMVKKGMEEKIVIGVTNLHDHFFTCQGESSAKITAARLPYFEGDFWPGVAEEILNKLLQEDSDLKQQRSKSKCANLSGGTGTSKDAVLMQKLGEAIQSRKDDFLVVHLQHACNHCGNPMVSGTRWACNSCQSFNLCEWCYDKEHLREVQEKHPSNSKVKHAFSAVDLLPTNTEDEDQNIEKEWFKTRLTFLSLCQKNYYEYESLRRAKYASMMVLYHLHLDPD